MPPSRWMGPVVASLALLTPLGCTAAEPAKGKVLFDFEQLDRRVVEEEDASARVVDGLDGKALEITTRRGSAWPGVTLSATDAKWDLTGHYAVVADVLNPEDKPVRVLLQLNNPGATGTDKCSCAAATIDPGKRGSVTVAFGEWHGQPKPLDESDIVSVRVFLDRPKEGHRFLVDNIRAIVLDRSAMEAVFAGDWFQSLENTLGRGVNMGNMLDAPREGEWGVRLEDSYFTTIAAAGFDNVRIPVRWSAHAAAEPPYTIDPAFLGRVDRAVQGALGRGLRVVLNIHHYDEIMAQPRQHTARLLALWEQIAERFRAAPPELWLELLNEPHGKLDAATWNELLNVVIPVIRKSNPDRMLVVGPPRWNSVDTLARLELPEDDRRIAVTFHYYNPFTFTHQGASWVGQQSQQWLGTEWHGTPAEQRAVIRQFDAAAIWPAEHRRPLYLGEFGAYSTADMDSRVRWTRFVAEQAMERKIGFSYWELCSGFGVYDAGAGAWREGLKSALLGE